MNSGPLFILPIVGDIKLKPQSSLEDAQFAAEEALEVS